LIPDRKPLRIAGELLPLETKALLCSIDHGLRSAGFGLANGAGCLNANDDAELHWRG
jgi:hypothetical protein